LLSKVLKAASPHPPTKAVLGAENVVTVRDSIPAVVPLVSTSAVQQEKMVTMERPLHGKSARNEVGDSPAETRSIKNSNSSSNSTSSSSSSEDSSDADSSSEESSQGNLPPVSTVNNTAIVSAAEVIALYSSSIAVKVIDGSNH
jgi:hypothetical protein